MNDTTMHRADRATHFKIVMVALVAGIAITGIGVAAAPRGLDMSTRLDARTHTIKPSQPVVWSRSESAMIR